MHILSPFIFLKIVSAQANFIADFIIKNYYSVILFCEFTTLNSFLWVSISIRNLYYQNLIIHAFPGHLITFNEMFCKKFLFFFLINLFLIRLCESLKGKHLSWAFFQKPNELTRQTNMHMRKLCRGALRPTCSCVSTEHNQGICLIS